VIRKLILGLFLAAALTGVRAQSAEERTARYLEKVREQPAALMDFLNRMPKGGDFHHHLTGAVYAESYINFAVEDNHCIEQMMMKIVPPPCDAGQDRVPASRAVSDFPFNNRAIDACSIWNFHLR
jgi:adenosine deaminase